MSEESTLRELLARHQEGIAGATALSLLFSLNYAVLKRIGLWRALAGAFTGCLTAGALWLFLAEYLHLIVLFIVPVSFVCGWGAYPLLSAWARKDDQIMDNAVNGTSKFLGRWLKKFGGST